LILWLADRLRAWADPKYASDLEQLRKDREAWEQTAGKARADIDKLQEQVVDARRAYSALELERVRLVKEADELRGEIEDLEKGREGIADALRAKLAEIDRMSTDSLLHDDAGLGPAVKEG
jgi:septal ring factor EnvC (AmiA/AmiB activator)